MLAIKNLLILAILKYISSSAYESEPNNYESQSVSDDVTHFVMYDNSVSTIWKASNVKGLDGIEYEYFEYIDKFILPKIKNIAGSEQNITYIEWNSNSQFVSCLRKKSVGGTQPWCPFELIEKRGYEHKKKYIHYITDGDFKVDSDSLGLKNFDLIKNDDKIDIYYLGDGVKHSVTFYQEAEKRLNERCRVFVNHNIPVDVSADVFIKNKNKSNEKIDLKKELKRYDDGKLDTEEMKK